MKNNRTTALLMLLVFLLVVAVVIIFLTGLDRTSARDNPYETVTSTAEPVITPEAPPAEVSAEPTPAATSAPVYYPASTSTPVSTAAPVSTARPASAAATPAPAVQATPTSALLGTGSDSRCSRCSDAFSGRVRFFRNVHPCRHEYRQRKLPLGYRNRSEHPCRLVCRYQRPGHRRHHRNGLCRLLQPVYHRHAGSPEHCGGRAVCIACLACH